MQHDIIDNSNIKLSSALKEKLAVSKRACFAVGWFFVSGLRDLREEIDQLDKLELLIGARTNRQTAEIMLLEKRYEEAVQYEMDQHKYVPPQEVEKIVKKEADDLIKTIGFMKPTPENVDFIKWLFEKLRTGRIEIRIYPKEVLHAKLYLLDFIDVRYGRGIAFVGSSNISMSGLNLNTELNVAVQGNENHKVLTKWFEKRWEESKRADFSILAQKALKQSWPLNETVTPFRVYLRLLHEMFDYQEQEIPTAEYGVVELWPFQKDAVTDAYHRLNDFNGVFLADVPGLGKTYMGAALLAHLQEDKKKAIVVCPPKLIEQWKEVLADFGVGTARVVSYGKLESILTDEKLMKREIVLIDESHHFRNETTNRYKDMELISEGKQVILVGATPQNLHIWDLYHQIKLFVPNETQHKFRIDPPNLRDYFKACEKGQADINDLINQIIIRRTRKDILDYYEKQRAPSFPVRKGPIRKDYSIDGVYPGGMFSQLHKLINELTFARYDLGSYIKEDSFTADKRQRIKQAGKNLKKIMKIIIFRRLESSIVAFKATINTLHKSHGIFLRALEQGKVLCGEAADDVLDQIRADVELEDIEIPDETENADDFFATELENNIRNDELVFNKIMEMVRDLEPEHDNKLQALISLMKEKHIKGKKALIFTAFAATAEYLGKELAKHFDRVDYVSLGTGMVLHKAKQFSPGSNNLKIKPEEQIDILVTTELLSEGMNLQDGQVVINYELHWNPVRIIQRVGRIDRIGSEHDEIWVYNFFPEQEAEKEIGIERKVKKRIEEIIHHLGADEKTISLDEQEVRRRLFQTYTEDESSLEEEEKESTSSYFKHQWVKLKKEYPEEYKKALALPAMAFCAATAAQSKGIAVFCRSEDYFRLMLADKEGAIINENDWEILKILECDPDQAAGEVYKTHFQVIETIRRKFEAKMNTRAQAIASSREKIKDQLIKKLEQAKRAKSQRVKSEINEVIDLIRSARLHVKAKQALRNTRNWHGFTIEELLRKIKGILKDTEQIESPKLERKFAQVIISESLR